MARTLIKTIVDTQQMSGPFANTRLSIPTADNTFYTFIGSPTLTFTPSSTGQWMIFTNAALYNNTAGGLAINRIFNSVGGATLVEESQGTIYGNQGDHGGSVLTYSTFTLQAGVSYSFDLQGSAAPGQLTQILADTVAFRLTAQKVGA